LKLTTPTPLYVSRSDFLLVHAVPDRKKTMSTTHHEKDKDSKTSLHGSK